ncbi:TrbI/VirB10 family protein [Rhizobium ruizarguesonis]
MQDSDSDNSGSGQQLDDHGHVKTPPSPDRDQLLIARRARQAGSSRRGLKARLIAAGALLAIGVGGVFIMTGPARALKLLGFSNGDTAQRTSQVGLNVDNETDQPAKLDFIVPAPTATPHTDTGLNDKIAALQDQIADLERNNRPGISSTEIQTLLKNYNDTVVQQLDAERKTMAAENARLQAEADKANEARRHAEEIARQEAEARSARDQKDRTQRESNAVVLDSSNDTIDVAELDRPDEERDPNLRFLKSNASSIVQTSVSANLADPSHMVVQGTIISAVLETAIDTTLPGTLRAQVMEPVYSFDGTRVMMPEGTVLIGAFNNEVGLAQQRVMIAWNRAITPDGKSIALGSIGTDLLGRSGTVGNVDNRYLTRFGAAALISAITAVPTILASQDKDRSDASGTTLNINGGSQVASGIGDNVGNQTSEVLGKYLSLPPVIRIPQGEEIRVFVNRDLVFK